MTLPAEVESQIENMLSALNPQPHTAQLGNTMELAQAEEEYGIEILDLQMSPLRVHVRCEGDDAFYLPLWAYNNRPYIRWLLDDHLVDVFLLPLE